MATAVNIPIVEQADLEVLGPVHSARGEARAARLLARVGQAEPDRGRGARAALRLRHPAAHRRRAERRLPGPRRPGRELRERADHRRGARARGLGAALWLVAALHQPRPDRGRGERRGDRGLRERPSGPEHRLFLAGALGYAIDIELAPLMAFLGYEDMPGSSAASGRCSARRASTSRTWPSPARRGREGAHGVLDRLAAPPDLVERIRGRASWTRASSTSADAGARGEAWGSLRVVSAWPEPVERVSSFLREAGAEARIEEFPEGTPTAADAAAAVGCELGQIVKSMVSSATRHAVVALVPGDRRCDPEKVARAVGAESARVARGGEVERATGFAPGAVAPFALSRVSTVLLDRTLLGHPVVWAGAGLGAAHRRDRPGRARAPLARAACGRGGGPTVRFSDGGNAGVEANPKER